MNRPISRSAVELVDQKWWQSLKGWHLRHRSPLRIVGLVALAAAVTLIVYISFPHTEDGTFRREFVNSVLGVVFALITAAIVELGTFWRRSRSRRELELQSQVDHDSWQRSALRVGRMEIPGVVVVASSGYRREWTEAIGIRFEDAPRRELPPRYDEIRALRIPEAQRRAETLGLTLRDDPIVDLVAANVVLERGPSGERQRVYEMRAAEATYFDVVATTADLDTPFLPDDSGGQVSLRSHFGIHPISIGDVSRLPVVASIATQTALITQDQRLVLGVRGRTFIAGRGDAEDHRPLVHVVAEGMLPIDRDQHGRLDPRAAAVRALAEEMMLGDQPESLGRVEEVRATGFYFDQLRWQPCFSYLARTDATWDELQTMAPGAMDYWEVERLVSLPFTLDNPEILWLLTGTHPDLALASNHAGAAVWFALVYEFGIYETRAALMSGDAVYKGA